MKHNIKFYRKNTSRYKLKEFNFAIAIDDFEPYFIGIRSLNRIRYLLDLGPLEITNDWQEVEATEVPINVLMMMDENYDFELKLFETNYPALFDLIKKEKMQFKPIKSKNALKLRGTFYTKTEAELFKASCLPISSICEIDISKFDLRTICDAKLKSDCLYSNISTYISSDNRMHFSAIEYYRK